MGRATSSRGLRRVVWSRAAAWLVLVVGLVLAAITATGRYSVVETREETSFRATSTNVQSVVSSQLARQDDLLNSVAGMVSATPTMTNVEFATWYRTARIADRFPGGLGVSYIEVVSPEGLDTFAAQVLADPITGLPDPSSYSVFPPGPAASYCLTRLGVYEVGEVDGFTIPAGLDYCAPELLVGTPSPISAVLALATDTGAPALVPMGEFSPGVLGEFLASYGRGGDPGTVDRRREQVEGWVAASFSADALVALAVAGQTDLAVAVERRGPSGVERVASAGDLAGGRATATLPVSADGTWTVTVVQAATPFGSSPFAQAIYVFFAGVVVSVLLWTLLRVLGGSRERALEMVREKTEELEHQAMHDTLTGLPNRALILDRAEQMLSRQARSGSTVAALFVDLDDFKEINDTLGHAAGDAYLREVGQRISSLFRGNDTVGRLGGDEFVVLLEGDPAGPGPELAARRILECLAEPIELEGVPVTVSCSIGLATGPRATAEDLLRDADLAMYVAKDAGKGAYAVFGEPADGGPDEGAAVRSGA